MRVLIVCIVLLTVKVFNVPSAAVRGTGFTAWPIPHSPACSHPIYCYGPLLEAVQLSRIFNDSKYFVDMPMKAAPSTVLSAAAEAHILDVNGSIPNPLAHLNRFPKGVDRTVRITEPIRTFVNTWFEAPGSDLDPWDPSDWQISPPLLRNGNHAPIDDVALRSWGVALNRRWKVLGRRVNASVVAFPDRHSLLPVPNPFVVPGGRFREFYYWDTYWIIKGLLLCNMTETARGMIENFALTLVPLYGMVPNGGRVYYTRRSQPPVLSLMVEEHYTATANVSFVLSMLPYLVEEHDFWMRNRSVTVGNATLNQYRVSMTAPRPESFLEDWNAVAGMSSWQRNVTWSELASGAETGWDFSSRWLANKSAVNSTRSIAVTDVVPVDLNAILYRVETTLSKLFTAVGNSTASRTYANLAAARHYTMFSLMWNASTGVWKDYNISRQGTNPSPSVVSFVPLWAGLMDTATNATKTLALMGLQGEMLNGKNWFAWFSGPPTSFTYSGQQWDYPNVWPPLVSFTVHALNRLGLPAALELAEGVAQRFVTSSYSGFAASQEQFMFEKYSCLQAGGSGAGGEYVPQNGFGWTNGVALELLAMYGATLRAPSDGTSHTSGNLAEDVSLGVFGAVVVLAIGARIYYVQCLRPKARKGLEYTRVATGE